MFVYELALALDERSTDLIARAQSLGIEVGTGSELSLEDIEKLTANRAGPVNADNLGKDLLGDLQVPDESLIERSVVRHTMLTPVRVGLYLLTPVLIALMFLFNVL